MTCLYLFFPLFIALTCVDLTLAGPLLPTAGVNNNCAPTTASWWLSTPNICYQTSPIPVYGHNYLDHNARYARPDLDNKWERICLPDMDKMKVEEEHPNLDKMETEEEHLDLDTMEAGEKQDDAGLLRKIVLYFEGFNRRCVEEKANFLLPQGRVNVPSIIRYLNRRFG